MPTIINGDPNERCSRCNRTHDNHDKEYCQSQPTPERSKCFMCGAEVCQWYVSICTECKMKMFNESESKNPPVNSREDTPPSGEERCHRCYDTGKYVEEDKTGAVMLMTCDHSPLPDRVGGDRWEKEKNLGNPKPCRDCGENIDNGEMYWRRRDIYICDSCSTPPSKQSEEVFGMKVEVDETMPDGTWKLKEGKATPPKAEGVGEWAEIFASDEQYRKDNGLPLDVPEKNHDEYLHVRGEVIRDALTSATRAAEERKDQAIRIFISEQRCINNVVPESDTSKGVRTILDRLERILPPPPSN